MSARPRPRARGEAKFAPTFRTLLVGHDPAWGAEATVVLAAMAARNGLRCDGSPMEGRTDENSTFDAGRGASLAWLARETGLHVGAVRRGVALLLEAGHATKREVIDEVLDEVVDEGLFAEPVALAWRWENPRLRIRLDERTRGLGMRAKPLLLTGLVMGQSDRSGRLALGIGFLSERTGFPPRTVQRTLATAQKAGALHRWTAPIGGGRLMVSAGPSRSGAGEPSQTGAREAVLAQPNETLRPHNQDEPRKVTCPPSQTGAPIRHEPACPPSQTGARHSDWHPESPPDSPTDTLPRVVESQRVEAGEQRSSESAPNASKGKLSIMAVVHRWVARFKDHGIMLMEARHAPDVAGLLDELSPPSTVAHRRALARERLEFARQVVEWCPSPALLCRWLLRVRTRFKVLNLGAYLRRAVERSSEIAGVLRRPSLAERRGLRLVRDCDLATDIAPSWASVTDRLFKQLAQQAHDPDPFMRGLA